jgi:hypothetical protein
MEIERAVILHLSNGENMKHSQRFKDDAEYKQWYEGFVKLLGKERGGVLPMNNPHVLYRSENIIAFEFPKPP